MWFGGVTGGLLAYPLSYHTETANHLCNVCVIFCFYYPYRTAQWDFRQIFRFVFGQSDNTRGEIFLEDLSFCLGQP